MHDEDQVPTRPTTRKAIMGSAHFALGVNDVRAGRSYRADYDKWKTDDQWNYERGRQWAKHAPRHVPLKIGNKLNPDAIHGYGSYIL